MCRETGAVGVKTGNQALIRNGNWLWRAKERSHNVAIVAEPVLPSKSAFAPDLS